MNRLETWLCAIVGGVIGSALVPAAKYWRLFA